MRTKQVFRCVVFILLIMLVFSYFILLGSTDQVYAKGQPKSSERSRVINKSTSEEASSDRIEFDKAWNSYHQDRFLKAKQ